jgi:hypothetical protein
LATKPNDRINGSKLIAIWERHQETSKNAFHAIFQPRGENAASASLHVSNDDELETCRGVQPLPGTSNDSSRPSFGAGAPLRIRRSIGVLRSGHHVVPVSAV